MNEMDGYEFLDQFEEHYPYAQSGTEVIVVSNSVRRSDKARSLAYDSVKEFISKPITINQLKHLLSPSDNRGSMKADTEDTL